jgi:Cystathionine beta-lyases/cystathionine gamma-synthases
MERDIETQCLHLNDKDQQMEQLGAVSYPIYQTATFARTAVGEGSGYDYSRLQNPTREHLEKIVAQLEGGIDAIAFTSGMAAISAMMELFKPGDHLIVDEDLYGGCVRLLQNISKKNGIIFSSINCSKESIKEHINKNTKAVFVETPTNPMMNVVDISELVSTAHAKNVKVIVDNTFLTPYFQNPLKLGADIVVHSGTKYLGGHNDTLAGMLVTADEQIAESLRFISKTTGANLAPFDSWLMIRGIKTLSIRMEKAQKNAIIIAKWLETRENVKKVIYPGLETHPEYAIIKKQSRGVGAMITFAVTDKDTALAILKNVNLIQFAESLGGTETLLTYPITQTHADVPDKELSRRGVTDKILRLSVGIEAVTDLIDDLEKAGL